MVLSACGTEFSNLSAKIKQKSTRCPKLESHAQSELTFEIRAAVHGPTVGCSYYDHRSCLAVDVLHSQPLTTIHPDTS